MQKTASKKGFTLVELAIVIAVIAALAVGLLFSDSLINSAKISSYSKKLNRIESALQEFQATHGNPGYMSFEDCVKNPIFQNSSRKFCRAMYCLTETTTSQNGLTDEPCNNDGTNTFVPSWPAPYIATKMLSYAGYIDSMPDITQSNGNFFLYGEADKITSPSILNVASGVKFPIGDSYFQNMTTGASVIQNLLPEFANGVNYHVDGGLSSPTYGEFYASLPYSVLSAFRTSVELGKRYYIKLSPKTPSEGASMTGELAYKLDLKIDDGNPASGMIVAARPILNSVCFTAKDNSSWSTTYGACNGRINSPYFDAPALKSAPDYSCFNVQSSGGTGNTIGSVAGFFNYGNTTAKYTASISVAADLIVRQGIAATGVTDADAKAAAKRATSDKTMGCNIMYITNVSYRE